MKSILIKVSSENQALSFSKEKNLETKIILPRDVDLSESFKDFLNQTGNRNTHSSYSNGDLRPDFLPFFGLVATCV